MYHQDIQNNQMAYVDKFVVLDANFGDKNNHKVDADRSLYCVFSCLSMLSSNPKLLQNQSISITE